MTIKQKIFNFLDNHSYLNDTELYKLYGKEPNWTTAEEYKRQWRRLQNDREFFQDKKIKAVSHHGTKHYVELENGEHYKIGKEFYEENKK